MSWRPSATTRFPAAHWRSWVERCDHAVMVSRVDAGDLGHPGGGVGQRPFHAQQAVQFAAQRRLIDDPGGAGFVIQRRAINRDELAVVAGLAVGHDHVGVQVRIPARDVSC